MRQNILLLTLLLSMLLVSSCNIGSQDIGAAEELASQQSGGTQQDEGVLPASRIEKKSVVMASVLASPNPGCAYEACAQPIIGKVLKAAKDSLDPDIILTPEYSFYDEASPLYLVEGQDGYTIAEGTSEQTRSVITQLQEIAIAEKTNIFASSFYTPEMGDRERNTMLFISSEGRIANIRTKYLAPQGRFQVKNRKGQTLEVLPLLCAEVYEFTTSVPWIADQVMDEVRYDILLHSSQQASTDYTALFETVQARDLEYPQNQGAYGQISNYIFDYGPFYFSMKEESHIMISDMAIAGIFRFRPTFEGLSVTDSYDIYEIDEDYIAVKS